MINPQDRLDSWKEIAQYLKRDERTVRRWELERSLPVHRTPGTKRSGVFAYPSELDHWLAQSFEFDSPKASPHPQQDEADALDEDFETEEVDQSLDAETDGKYAPEPIQASGNRSRNLRLCTAAVLLAIAFAALGYFAARLKTAPRVAAVQRLTFQRGVVRSARFRPDGRNVVYAAAWQGAALGLYETSLDRPESATLNASEAHAPEAQLLAVSSTSRLAVLLNPQFHGGEVQFGALAVQGLYESRPEIISANASSADWSPDGSTLAYTMYDSKAGSFIKTFSRELHEDRTLYPAKSIFDGWFAGVRYSPNGRLLAFEQHRADGKGYVVILNPQKGSTRTSRLYSSLSGLAWSRNGKEVWFTATEKGLARSLRAIDLSGSERLLYLAPAQMTLQDISKTGDVLITRDFSYSSVFVNRPQEKNGATEMPYFDWSVLGDISNDGKWIAFGESGEALPRSSIFIRNSDGSTPKPLGEASLPASISPDNTAVLALTNEPCPRAVMFTPDKSSRTLTQPGLCVSSTTWLPDGRHFIFVGSEKEEKGRCYVQSIDGNDAKPFTEKNTRCGLVSPDGEYALASRGNEFFKVAIHRTEAPAKIAFPARYVPLRWESSQRVLAIEESHISEIVTVDLASGQIVERVPIKLPEGVENISFLKVSADKKSYTFSADKRVSDLYVIQGLR
jgi:Tol biopolymer transport system component